MLDRVAEGLDPAILRLLFGEKAPPEVPQLVRGAGLRAMAIHAARREIAVARSRAGDRGAVWRRRPNLLLGTPRERAAAWLTMGAVLGAPRSTSLGSLLHKASFIARPGPPSLGADNSLRLIGSHDGNPAVLRVGIPGTPSDPSVAAHALEVLAGVPSVPALRDRGDHDGWVFTVEELLSGAPATTVTPVLVTDLSAWFLALAQHPVPGTSQAALAAAIASNARVLATAGPAVADRVFAVAETLAAADLLVPAPLHGDLWARNVLLVDGHLSGIVDWDGFTPVGAAGVDLVHTLAVDLRMRRRTSSGAVAATRPWARREWSEPLSGVLDTWGGPSGPDAIDAVGTAWWLTTTAASLRRIPRLAHDLGWLRDNVEVPARVLAP